MTNAYHRLANLSTRRKLALIVLFGFLFKIASLLMMIRRLQGYGLAYWDSMTYYAPAMAMAHGSAFHSEVRTPGYSAFLAILYFLTRDPNPISNLNLIVIFSAQAILLSFSCLPVFYATRHLTGDERISLGAAFIWAINNSSRYYSNQLLTEALTAAVMCCYVYFLARSIKENQARWYAGIGATMFYLTLLRPSVSLLAIPTVAGIIISRYLIQKDRDGRALIAIVSLLLIFPLSSQWLWAERNAIVEGERYYCRLSAFGAYVYGAAYVRDSSQGEATDFNAIWNEFFSLLPKMTPQSMDRMYERRTFRIVRRHPAALSKFLAKSSLYLLMPSMNKPNAYLIGDASRIDIRDDKPLDTPQNQSERRIFRYRDTIRLSFWKQLSFLNKMQYSFFLVNSALEFTMTCVMLGLILFSVTLKNKPESASLRGFLWTAILLLLYWIPVHAIAAQYVGPGRFLLPLMPVLIVAAGAALSERIRERAI